MAKEEFDTCDLAWLTYRIFYGIDLKDQETKDRKYIELQVANTGINMSGDTDFNFGPGWSHSISNKFEKYLADVPRNYDVLYKSQLQKCKKMYKSILNISLMPQTGNLQSAKKGIGNDRLDTFIWALDSYYNGETSLLFNNSSFQNTTCLKNYLNLFKIDGNEAIYNYCSKIYGIDRQLVDDLILSGKEAIDSPERVIAYMLLAYRFWRCKLNHIKSSWKNMQNLLSCKENKIIKNAIEEAEKKLNTWFES